MAHPMAHFESEAKALLEAALASLHPDVEPQFVYGPAPPGKGDLAAGCFPYAKTLKANPAAIAADIAQAAETLLTEATGRHAWVDQVESVGPYVNVHVKGVALARAVLASAHEAPETFGNLDPRDETVILEHTSANPNGPLHVGRARNPVIGDTLVRLHRAAGYTVDAQYYVDDMGKQVAILAWGLEHLTEDQVTEAIGPARTDKVDHKLVRYYQAANGLMEKDDAIKAQIQKVIRDTEEGDPAALERVHAGYKDVFAGMLESLQRLNVHFDTFVEESRFVANGDTARVIDRLRSQTEIPVGAEGDALYLDLETKGITGRSTKFFFRRGDGTSLYATRDVAYHLWKAQQANRLVNVLGEDHKLQAKQVRICLEALDAPHLPEVAFYSFVSLPEGKMSTRANRVVFIDDLLEEAVTRAYDEVKQRRGEELTEQQMRHIAELVGVGAIRFTIIKVQCEKPITFEWEDALSFDGFASPFIQYSHARVAGIQDKAEAAGIKADPSAADALVHASELGLVKTLARMPTVIDEAVTKTRPHQMAQYAYDIATAFNQFYRDCHVVDPDQPDVSAARLALVEASRVALARSLDLLGIAAPDQM